MQKLTSKLNNLVIRTSASLATIATVLVVPTAVFAQQATVGADVTSGLTRTGGKTGLQAGGLPEMIGLMIRSVIGVLGIVLVVLIIYAGFLWMTAQGEEEKVTKAKDIIKNSVIGLIIIMMAYSITTFVVNAIVAGTSVTQ